MLQQQLLPRQLKLGKLHLTDQTRNALAGQLAVVRQPQRAARYRAWVACRSTKRVVWIQTSNQVRLKARPPPPNGGGVFHKALQHMSIPWVNWHVPAVCTMLALLNCAQGYPEHCLDSTAASPAPLCPVALRQHPNHHHCCQLGPSVPQSPQHARVQSFCPLDLQAVLTASVESGYDHVLSTPATAALVEKWQELATFNTLTLKADGTITDTDAKQVGGAADACRAFSSSY